MNAALSVILSLTTVLAGGAAALGGDLLSPHSLSSDDCIVGDLCTDGGHGNETSDPENGTADPEPEPESEPEPEEEPETEPEEDGNRTHYHHHHNATDDGDEGDDHAEPSESEDKPEDVYFCTTDLVLFGEDYSFGWEVHDGFEEFTLDWHFQPLGLGLFGDPDVQVELLDGAGTVVFSASGDDARGFFLDTDDLIGYAAGEWTFTVISSELIGDQGLAGHVNY